jgi:hypothetical protein
MDSKGDEKKASQNYQTDTVGKVPRDYENVLSPKNLNHTNQNIKLLNQT